VNLKELLGFGSYNTAWCWLQKLRRCTIRQDREKLAGSEKNGNLFIREFYSEHISKNDDKAKL